MPDIHISRDHSLGLPQARKLAFRWAETAEAKLGMECRYEEGKSADLLSFNRSGVNGELKVTANRFELDARLGMLLGAFKHRIETEIVKNLDLLLAEKEPLKAFDHAMEKRAVAKRAAAAKHAAAKRKG